MKGFLKKLVIYFLAMICAAEALAQTDSLLDYKMSHYMIPMRDGIKLYTVILSPKYMKGPFPLLIQRTPYGAGFGVLNDTVFNLDRFQGLKTLAKSGFIFVFQDIRGKYKSEGNMQIHQPLIHETNKKAVDESTDTYDAVEWLIHNIQENNGKAGILGISYPGWLALVGSVDPHPALKASSEQACMGDLFLGDDFHHNGAFRLSYGMEYSYEIEFDKTTDSEFPFPEFDLFNWYLKLGSLKNVNTKYFHGKIPTWNHFVEHPSYDSFWKTNSPLSYVHYPQIPMLNVGGYYDQEDLNGPQLMYAHLEKKDSFNRNFIVLGPWFHGQWGFDKGDSLGKIAFGSETGTWFRELQRKWFDYWLKGIGDGKFDEANSFQTGSNQWKTYSSWPPKEAAIKNLYLGEGHSISFAKPTSPSGKLSYVSDPNHPVPYRTLPIERTYGRGSRWRTWHLEDQRFASTRPDVVCFTMDSLDSDLIVTGKIKAHLFASTTGTDADWIVKLIDVYPSFDPVNILMSGYQYPVAMEVFRGRFRKSFENPEALVAGKPEEFVVDLHEINHVFRKGHRIMVQVQSSWFPVIDRNPQKFVPNIFEAKDSDFTSAVQTIYFNQSYPSHIELPIMKP
jgi:putative CocE/NonD family hydrolase